jgi:hypothetical protein
VPGIRDDEHEEPLEAQPLERGARQRDMSDVRGIEHASEDA